MSIKDFVLDKNLPPDDEVLAALIKAKSSGIHPAEHIGTALQDSINSGSSFSYVIARYPKTLAWLCHPDNLPWIINDLERTLQYLRSVSDHLNQ